MLRCGDSSVSAINGPKCSVASTDSYGLELEPRFVAWSNCHRTDGHHGAPIIECHLEVRKQRCEHYLRFGQGKRCAEANARTRAKGHERAIVGPRCRFARETVRDESCRLGPKLAVTMEHPGTDPDKSSGCDALVHDNVIGNGFANDVS